ncbi:hypothetical protein [Streptococcus pyogenes]|nr:hypothetical protein [Streptococcus pyogenes]
MLIGAIIDRVKTSHLLLLVVVWISLVYTLLAIVCGGFSWSLVTLFKA